MSTSIQNLGERCRTDDAVDTLDRSYERPDSHGLDAVVRFVGDEDNLELRADVYGRAQALLEAYRRRCEQTGHSTC